MPMEKFTFDGPNKQFVARPSFVGTDGIMEVDVQEDIYSAWKDVVKEDDNLKYDEAIRTVGGDPISGTQNLGATFFLINGWRILPDSQDHRLQIVGNIFTDPAGDSISDFPSSGVVIVENTVSNLIDQVVTEVAAAADDSPTDDPAIDLLEIIHAILRGKTITDPVTGVMTIFDAAGAVLYTANIFEDAAGATPYGSGSTKIERRERLE